MGEGERPAAAAGLRRLVCGAALLLLALLLAPAAFADTFVVTSNADTGDDQNPGTGTLRAAIIAANNLPGADTITFDLPFAQSIITPQANLPTVTDTLTIDGSVPGAVNGQQHPRIDGSQAPTPELGVGLDFDGASSGSLVRGLTLTSWGQWGIGLNGVPMQVAGNYIGTDAAGTANEGDGIGVFATGAATIGGTTPADRNVISGNQSGVYLGTGSGGTTVQGNYIGTDPSGRTGVANGQGVFINGGSADVIENNVISGNFTNGVRIDPGDSGSKVFGNLIGVAANGFSPLGNGSEGVVVNQNNIDNNTIGSGAAGQGNTIANNGDAGVLITGSGRGDSIQGNKIYDNQNLGIDLAPGGAEGVTPNDEPNDADTGPNELQNFPDLTSATGFANGNAEITGQITGSLPGSTYTVDFYASTTAQKDPSGNGEGARYLGQTVLNTGSFPFQFDVVVGAVVAGDVITATATDTFGDTSEFSPSIAVTGSPPANGGTYTVTTTDDTDDGSCTPSLCSLRDAINAVNLARSPDPATIDFAIPPGVGTQVIRPTTQLPTITAPVVINGASQGGVPLGTLAVQIDGSQVGAADGLVLGPGSDQSIVEGLAVTNFSAHGQAGIRIQSNRSWLRGNYIGLAADGSTAAANYRGVIVNGNADEIGGSSAGDRNVISGNSDAGVLVDGTAVGVDGTTVDGNYIGLPASGDLPTPAFATSNGGPGVWVLNATHTTVGGTLSPSQGNVITGNFNEVMLGSFSGASNGNNTVVENNRLGLSADGSASEPNPGSIGVDVQDAGTNTIAQNTIASTAEGVDICASNNNKVSQNLIGSNAVTGGPDFGVSSEGITVQGGPCTTPAPGLTDAATGNAVGGGNTVLNSGARGIAVYSDGNAVSNNTVSGTKGDAGIFLAGSQNTVAANSVTANQHTGVAVVGGATQDQITQNSIDGNGGLGIDLGNDGVTPNDPGDGDTGPNNLQNFPTLTTASSDGETSTVSGTLNSTPNLGYTIEFFASSSCNASSNGEGKTYIGTAEVNTDGNGNASFSPTLAPVTPGDVVTATATEDFTGDTSEFSACATVTSAGPPVNTVAPTLSATQELGGLPLALLGNTLTVVGGQWTNSPTSITYEWQRCDSPPDVREWNNCADISGQTSNTYTLASADLGHTIQVVVTASNTAGGTSVTLPHSDLQGSVGAPNPLVNDASIAGFTQVGNSLTAKPGTWGGEAPITFDYTWSRCDAGGANCSTVSGISGDTYPLTPADAGHVIGVLIVGVNPVASNGWHEALQTAAIGPILVVNDAGDTDDGACTASLCTLRDAINAANAAPGSTIQFDLPGATTIYPLSDLPAVTAPTTIDATTQPGYAGTPLVELNGEDVPGGDGFQLLGGDATVRGFVIDSWSDAGVFIAQNDGNTVAGNFIGIDVGGIPTANGEGVVIRETSNGNTIGGTGPNDGNVISGNGGYGIDIGSNGTLFSSNNTIEGNYVGPDGSGGGTPGVTGNSLGGIVVAGANNTIGGTTAAARNFISANDGDGILVQGPGNVIKGNTIGLAASADIGLANSGDGIDIEPVDPSRPGTTIGDTGSGGNVISGNFEDGIFISQTTQPSGTTIAGNLIGTDARGGSGLGNGGDGIDLNDGGYTTIDSNTISGNGAPGSENQNYGIEAFGLDSDHTTITRNKIGTDQFGANAVPNLGDGVYLSFPVSDTVGGTLTLGGGFGGPTIVSLGNVMSGNAGYGLRIENADTQTDNTTLTTVLGNKIGTDAAASSPLPNGAGGVIITTSDNTQIGGTGTPIEGNVVSGNTGDGIDVGSGNTSIVVDGNFIGTNAGGAAGLGNSGDGVQVTTNPSFPTTSTVVGKNTIENNGNAGVAVPDPSLHTTITTNSIDLNGGLGIDLGAKGVTPNGTAGFQSFPTLTTVGSTSVAGSVPGLASDGPYTVEIFDSPDCDASNNGEGARLVGSATVFTDAFGNGPFTASVSGIGAGDVITATATSPAGDTSEFSPCFVDAAAPTGQISIAADASSVSAGAADVQLSNVPPASFLDAHAALGSAPVGSIPVGSIPVGSIPVGSIPVGSIPVGSIGFAAGESLLSSVALSTIPLTPPQSWSNVLAGTSLANEPLQSVTLADVLRDPTASSRLSSVPVGSIDLGNSPLGSLTPAAIGLGSTPVGSIPVPPASGESSSDSTLQRWCTWLSGPPLDCTDPTTLTNTTMVSAALDGAPVGSIPVGSIPVGSIPVGSIPVGSIQLGNIPVGSITVQRVNIQYSPVGSIPVGSIPVGSIPVGSIPVGSIPVGSIDLANSPVGSIPVGSIPVGSIGDVFTCVPSCPSGGTLFTNQSQLVSGLTLEDLLRAAPGAFANITFADVIAYTDPAVLAHYTILDLINSLPPNSGITYGDILALLLDPSSLDWESLNLDALHVQTFASNGSTLGYHADFSLTGAAGTTTAIVRATLPSAFLYKPGTSHLLVNNGSGFVDAATQPTDPTISGSTLRWSIGSVTVGSPYRLTFTTLPGLTLGPQAATATVRPASGTASAPSAPGAVNVTDTLESNDTPATAHAIQAGHFYLSYITSSSDVDYYSLPVPSAGTRTTFLLSHLPADYDLVVYGPSGTAQQLVPPSSTTPPLDGQPLADNGYTTTSSTSGLAPQTLNDVALASGLPVYGVSTLRGTQDDSVAVISDGEPGNYTIQVSGFNGATSNDPYMLRVQQTPPPSPPQCVARSFAGTGTAATSLVTTAPGQLASAVNTVFVVDDQQLERIYGSDGAGVVSNLASSLGGFASAGYPAAVVHVDANAAVQSAYAAWNGCPANPALANNIVQAINNVLATVRTQFPNVEYEVLVGGNDALPFAEIDDLTTLSNENGYAETFPLSSALGGSTADSKILTDDPYAATQPVPFLNRQLYVPNLVVSRLVETPANINAQLSAFTGGTHPGRLLPATELTTGHTFLSDGAQAVDSALTSDPAITSVDPAHTLIGDTWTHPNLTDLLLPAGGVAPDIVSLNAHASHNQFAPPAAGSQLFTANEIENATQSFGGRLVFSMGCHAGLNVVDAFVANDNLDWAQAFADKGAADYVANTGFGYGDSTTIAYSEELNRLFAQNLVAGASGTAASTFTVGEALTVAKQAYKGELGIVGVYDEKAMAELTMYGLPMYKVGGPSTSAPTSVVQNSAFQAGATTTSSRNASTTSATPTNGPTGQNTISSGSTTTTMTTDAPASPSFSTDPITGLQYQPFAADNAFTDPSQLKSGDGGSYYVGNNGDIVEHFRPIEPRAIEPLTIGSVHGALLTQLNSFDASPSPHFQPAYARPIVDDPAHEPPVTFDDAAFPSKLQAVTTFQQLSATKQQVVLAQGQFFSNSPNDGQSDGTQRLFTHEAGIALSSTSTDYTPPTFSTLSAQKVGSSVSFSVNVTADQGATVKRVLVAYNDGSSGTWNFVDLLQAGTGSSQWTGGGALASSSSPLQYFVQAVDSNGNVAVSTNKGFYYNAAPLPPPPTGGVALTPAQTPSAGGWFDGPVDLSATVNGLAPAAGTVTVSVDGGQPQTYNGAVHVTGDGPHTVTALASNGGSATMSFVVDSGPTVAINGLAAGAILAQDQPVTPSFTCAAALGVKSCVVTSAPFSDSTVGGPFTYAVTATDNIGKTITKSITYTVRNAVDASVSAGTLSGDGWYTTAPTITAQSPAGVTGNPPAGVVTYTVNGGGSQAYTAPFQLTSDGTYNVVFTAYGHTKQLTVKVDLTLPTISITTPPTGTTYQRSTVVNAAYACVETTLGVTVAPTCAGVVTLPSGSTVNVANGGALPTDALGTYQLKVSSTDHAGRTTSLTRSYSVGTPTIAGKIVFARSGKIWSINPDGTGLAQLTQIAGRDASGTWIDDQPAKSPDGTKIVFARRTSSTGQSQLWVIDADGRNPKQLTTGTGDNSAPAFSPDGTKIAFQSNRTGSKGYDIWVGNWSVSTSTLSSLTNLTNIAGDDVQPSWSPTSVGKIAFASNRSPQMQFEIFTMTTKGSSATRLTNDTGTDREPTWSPDGTKIAWSSDRANHGVAGAFDIYVMGAPNGNNQVRLTTLAGDDTAPFFFSNSQIVFASATVGSSGGLAIMAPTGGTPTKIPNTAAGDANPG